MSFYEEQQKQKKLDQQPQTPMQEQMKALNALQALDGGGEKLDLAPFEGQRNLIQDVKIEEVSSQFSDRLKQWVVRVIGTPVKQLKKNDGTEIHIRPTEMFNLAEDEKSNPKGWFRKGNLQKFLDKMKCVKPEELIGKEGVIRLKIKKGKTVDDDRQFLGYIY